MTVTSNNFVDSVSNPSFNLSLHTLSETLHGSINIFCVHIKYGNHHINLRNLSQLEGRLWYNVTCCVVWVWNLVCHTKGRKYIECVWEQGIEDTIWT